MSTATLIGQGHAGSILSEAQVRSVVEEGLASLNLNGKRVLFIIPDSTRTAPVPLFFRLFCEFLQGKAAACDFLIALGTHKLMDDTAVNKLVGITPAERTSKYVGVKIFNHEWHKPETFAKLGHLSSDEVKQVSRGLLAHGVDVTINKKVLEYDQLIVCGPVFPHEVVGFSGGNKYFFPGVSGPEVINLTHWLGALITSFEIIGTGSTPVREIINRVANLIPTPKACFGFVVKGYDLAGVYFGSCEEAWAAAAELSAQTHVIYVDKPFKQIISVMPTMYDDIWTASKGLYKMEPVCEAGGEVIIYAPHITEISYSHGKQLDESGYHVRDYFVKQWDKFKHMQWGVLAHSTHLKGMGTYENGIERPRITVTLATQISEERCRRVNLGYRDPASIDLKVLSNREAEGILVVPKAGEMLYRLKKS